MGYENTTGCTHNPEVVAVGAIAVNVHGIRNMKVYNNLFIGGQWVAIRLNNGCTGSQVYNNIVVGIDPVQVDASSKDGTTADYNMASLPASLEPNPLIGPHDIFGKTPVFVDPERMLFRLKAGSPGAGAGLDLTQQGGFSTDKDGIKRPAGKPWDIGPYQGEGKPYGLLKTNTLNAFCQYSRFDLERLFYLGT